MSNNRSLQTQLLFAGTLIPAIIILIQFISLDVFRYDRIQHCTISGLSFVALFLLFRSHPAQFVIATVGALLIGFLKEFTDPSYDMIDVFANTFGVTIGLVAVIVAKLLCKPVLQKSKSRGYSSYRYRTHRSYRS